MKNLILFVTILLKNILNMIISMQLTSDKLLIYHSTIKE